MNNLQITSSNLPQRFEDVAAFAVIAQEKLKSVRAEISAIKRLGLAKEVYEQKLREAQELGEIKLRAEMKLGELTQAMPKQPGARTDLTSSPTVTRLETKSDALKRVNIPKQKASQYETLAAHPEIVEQAIAEARENDDIVSRSLVLDKVRAKRHEEERKKRAEADERIEASRQSTQAFLDTVKKQHGVEIDNTVDLNTYQVAKREAEYLRQIDDERQYRLLEALLRAAGKLPEPSLYESMWRGSYDTKHDVERMKVLIDQLNDIMRLFIKKGERNVIDDFFDELDDDQEDH